ncbi:MAG: hypothetical protein PHV16_03125 [Candidatus Nanoarchaeia archaeon]|nr:hypothetical protein [Candidatus Nanoarchaeia archaeon]
MKKTKKPVFQPLPGTFMMMGIIGFTISLIYSISGKLDLSWGVSFILVFLIIILASIKSMTPTGKI